MKKNLPTEDLGNRTYAFFDLPEFATLVPASGVNSQTVAVAGNTQILDKMLSGIKWTFIYAPGVVAMHMIMLGFAFITFFYHDWAPEMLFGTIGAGIIYSFMIMFGIGKLSDLRYLRVVGAVAASSAIAAILYSLFVVLVRGQFFGSVMMITLLIPLLTGFFVKRKTDRQLESA